MDNVKSFRYGYRLPDYFATDPTSAKEGDIFRFKSGSKHVLRMCIGGGLFVDVGLGAGNGTVNGSMLAWDSASSSWKENATIATSSNRIANVSGDLTIASAVNLILDANRASIGLSTAYRDISAISGSQFGYGAFLSSNMATTTAVKGGDFRSKSVGGSTGTIIGVQAIATQDTGTTSMDEVYGINAIATLTAGSATNAYGVVGSISADAGFTSVSGYVASVLGAFDDAKGLYSATNYSAAIMGVIKDRDTAAPDGAVVALLEGDSLRTPANKAKAAFKVIDRTTTSGVGFDYGLDLYHSKNGESNVFQEADIRLSSGGKISNPSAGDLRLHNGLVEFKVPAADGIGGQMMVTDGLGTLSWQQPSQGRGIVDTMDAASTSRPSTYLEIASISRAATTVTVETSTAHGFSGGEIVGISDTVYSYWSSITTYDLDESVAYGGKNYKSLQAGNLGNLPSSSPTYWEIVENELDGVFTIAYSDTTHFTYTTTSTGKITGTAAGGVTGLINGLNIFSGMKVLFTALSDSSLNKRIVTATLSGGAITWANSKVGQDTVNGDPVSGDDAYVAFGTLNRDTYWFYDGSVWYDYSAALGASKADKVVGAVAGNFAALDASGNLVDSGVSPTGIVMGQAYITNAVPTGSGNVGSKVYSSDGAVLDSAVTDTELVTISVLALPAMHNYKPTVTLSWGAHSQVVTMSAGVDKPLFTGSAAIDLDGETVVTVTHEDGASNTCTLAVDVPPTILTGVFTGGYPGSQTELKLADTFQFNVVSDLAIVAIEFDNYGAYSAQSFSVSSGTNHTVTGVIANRGTTAQLLGAKVRVQKSTGSWSDWFLSTSAGSVDGVNVVNLNNLRPSVSISTITYPSSQSALKDSETATVSNTVSNYTSVAYTSANGDLSISNDTTYEASKTVTRISGSYNVSTNNFRVTATRSQNNSTTYADTIVKIANVACTVSITLPASRLRSGGSDGTSAQNHVVTLTANQQLYAAPTLTAGLGTWQGGGFAGGPTVWTRSLQITDTMVKGAYSFSSLTATNLAGIVTNTILSGSSYTVGGFVSRQITLAAFANEVNMNVEATDYTKVTLSWDFKPSLVTRSPLNSTPPIVDNWCLVALNTNPTVIRILDTAATSSCSVASIITIEEAV